MEHLTHLITFARVVQAGSFAGGAERLQMAASVASKHVSKLEKRLGARLLHRSTRKLSLTEAGIAFYEHCIRILEEIEQAQNVVAQLQGEPRGQLRISAMPSFTNFVLARLMPDFLRRYPGIHLEVVANERMVDLADEGFDLALRVTREPASHLVARRLAAIHFVACASPEYFTRHGMPLTPEDLAGHNCLGYPQSMVAPQWRFNHEGGDVAITAQGNVEVNSVDALRTLTLAGAGIALLPTYAVGSDLRDGRLAAALPGFLGFGSSTLFAVYLPNRFGSPKIRAFIDFLAERIGPVPFWEADGAPGPDGERSDPARHAA